MLRGRPNIPFIDEEKSLGIARDERKKTSRQADFRTGIRWVWDLDDMKVVFADFRTNPPSVS
jgi:hypothetical protein